MADSSSDSDFFRARIGRWPPLRRTSHNRARNYGAEEVTEKIHTLASTLQVAYREEYEVGLRENNPQVGKSLLAKESTEHRESRGNLIPSPVHPGAYIKAAGEDLPAARDPF